MNFAVADAGDPGSGQAGGCHVAWFGGARAEKQCGDHLVAYCLARAPAHCHGASISLGVVPLREPVGSAFS